MHVDNHAKQYSKTVRDEGRIGQGARCAPCDEGDATMSDHHAPVWDHVIKGLLAGYCGAGALGLQFGRRSDGIDADATWTNVQVEVIERLSDRSVAVLWQDATRGRYAEQVWISCRARVKGRCALSGAAIRRHDLIYKPRWCSAAPANADAMILAAVIARRPSIAAKGESR